MDTPTTVKIEGLLHSQLKASEASTRLSKADLLRLSLDIGLPRIGSAFQKLRSGDDGEGKLKGLVVLLDKQQLQEARELYKSGVTDIVSGIDTLKGDEFVAEARRKLKNSVYKKHEKERAKRFLAIYAQLF